MRRRVRFGAIAVLLFAVAVAGLLVMARPGSDSPKSAGIVGADGLLPNGLLPNGLFPHEAEALPGLDPTDPSDVAVRDEILRTGAYRLQGGGAPATTEPPTSSVPPDVTPSAACIDKTPPDNGISEPGFPVYTVGIEPNLSQGRFALGGVGYALVTGALRDDPQQGVIVRYFRSYGCYDDSSGGPTVFRTPGKDGAVRLLERDGSTVRYETINGTTGTFDFVRGKFV